MSTRLRASVFGRVGITRSGRVRSAALILAVCAVLAPVCLPHGRQSRPNETVLAGLRKNVKHVIVIYQENWSFDGLYGRFPGANGVANAGAAIKQVHPDGTPYDHLPQPLRQAPSLDAYECDGPTIPDLRFSPYLPVEPYDMLNYMHPDSTTGDLIHRFYHEQLQIDGGKMDQFVAWSDNGGLVMGRFDAAEMPEGKLAQKYVLCDNFFHSAFGGSFLNHQFLIAATAPIWPNAPKQLLSQPPDPSKLASMKPVDFSDNEVTPDGYIVNTAYTINNPHPINIKDSSVLAPAQTHPTIGDRMSEKDVSWKWYSGGWNRAAANDSEPLFQCQFQFHHQPFAYFKNYAEGTPGRRDHLADEEDFTRDLQSGHLPSVCFIKAFGPDNEHPGYADLATGQKHTADLVTAIQNSKIWDSAVIIITYDENGGRWDHVAPPVRDGFGPGSRVPAIIISPMSKNGIVDHTQYETLSILKFIESIFGLEPLNMRDARATNLLNAFK